MPPQRSSTRKKSTTPNATSPSSASKARSVKASSNPSTPSKKRKASISAASTSSNPRTSTRRRLNRHTNASTPSKSTIDPLSLFTHLLSPKTAPLTRPDHETSYIRTHPTHTTYTSTHPLPPYHTLLSALLLSRPISHALGQRSIRTLFNPPYSLTTPGALADAGGWRVHDALVAARTQHKGKTAAQIEGLSEVLLRRFAEGPEDVGLGRLRGQVGDAQAGEETRQRLRETLTREIKGVGQTGAEIFLRRVQAVWGECYPFVDGRTGESLSKLGLPGAQEEIRTVFEACFDELKEVEGAEVDSDGDEERKRALFVKVMERAIGADLQGNVDKILQGVREGGVDLTTAGQGAKHHEEDEADEEDDEERENDVEDDDVEDDDEDDDEQDGAERKAGNRFSNFLYKD